MMIGPGLSRRRCVFVKITSNGRDFLFCRQLLMPRRWRQTAVIECPVAFLRASRRPCGDDTVLCHHPPHLGSRDGANSNYFKTKSAPPEEHVQGMRGIEHMRA